MKTKKILSVASTRRCFYAGSVLAVTVGMIGSALPSHAQIMTIQGTATVAPATPVPTTSQVADDRSIRPFKIDVPQEALTDLRRRIAATRWPDRETVSDSSQGAERDKLQALVRYWGTGYDWRKVERRLNSLPQFVTTIDGVDIHFIHVRARQPNALPIIITHGWPGSIIEQLKIIDPLTDPTAHGGSAQDAFDVVIPSVLDMVFLASRRAPAGIPIILQEPGPSL